MKLEEFGMVLQALERTTSGICGLLVASGKGHAVLELENIWRNLDKHRLEMEAAEHGEPMPDGPGLDGPEARLDAIENRLGEIEQKAERRARSLHYQ